MSVTKEQMDSLRGLAAEANPDWARGRLGGPIAVDRETVLALLDRIEALEAGREKARKAWAECDARMEHYFRCEAPHDAAFTDPRCDCGLRAPSEALA